MIVEERPEKEGTERISVRTRQREQQVQRPWGGGLWSCTSGAERGPLQLEWRESAEERWEVRSEMLAGASHRGPWRNSGVILRILLRGQYQSAGLQEKDQFYSICFKKTAWGILYNGPVVRILSLHCRRHGFDP